jgi:hypothetical protein
MATLKTTRGLQYPLLAEFTFNYNDDMLNTSGVSSTFGSGAVLTNVDFKGFFLPVNAVLVGGEIIVETAYAGPTVATVSVGDSGSATRYANAVDIKTAARTALTLTGFRSTGADVQLRLNTTVAVASAGKVTVRIMYVIQDRANEVQTH